MASFGKMGLVNKLSRSFPRDQWDNMWHDRMTYFLPTGVIKSHLLLCCQLTISVPVNSPLTWRPQMSSRVKHYTILYSSQGRFSSHVFSTYAMKWGYFGQLMMTSSNGKKYALLAICVGIHRSPVNSPHKGQRRGALMFLSSAPELTIEWFETHRANYDVT